MQKAKGGRSSDGEESPDTTGRIVQSKGWMPQGKPAVRKVPQKRYRPAMGKGEKAVLKRSGSGKETEDTVAIDGLTVNFTARRVTVDGQELDLSPKEYDLLFYMVRNRGIALSREKLISDVWGYDFFGDDRTLDTHIKLLRRQLGRYADRITTLRGVGYRFEKE